jgi:imidazolonepropionase
VDVVIRNTSEVVTALGEPGEPVEKALAAIPRGAVGIIGARLAFLGPENQLPADAVGPETRVIDAGGGFVGPGFVDPHTHLVFAGERSGEFDLRCQGKSYLEIAAAGGGISSTVKATRAASETELMNGARHRLRRLVEHGVLAAEVKSGYGLTAEDELKMLRIVHRLQGAQPVTLVSTLLCAHAVPPEYEGRREQYVDLCVNEIIPRVAQQKLATFCDAFVEQGAFTPDEARRILRAGRDAGLTPRLHADQLSDGGGAALAAELGAATADHLEHVSDAGIQALARAGVFAVLVPTSTLFLRMRQYAPGRKLRDAGVNVALATNLNPGSAMSESVPLALGLACLENGLTAAEAYWAATRGAALALGLEGAGRLKPNGQADVVVFGCKSYTHLPYHLGMNHVRWVIKGGDVVVQHDADHHVCE